jgi:hypothetical protein
VGVRLGVEVAVGGIGVGVELGVEVPVGGSGVEVAVGVADGGTGV